MNTFSHVPPGFRFHPTDEELVDYYLRKKIASKRIDLDVIKDVDLYKIEPWDLQELCKISNDEQNEWYFFSHKDKKYPTGTRTNRATKAGFWKATGRDKAIYSKHSLIGMRKTLVFYKGRAPNGQKSDWIMHEYRLETNENATPQEEGWVVCRVFKKRIATIRKEGDYEQLCWYDDQVSFMPTDFDHSPRRILPPQQHYNNNNNNPPSVSAYNPHHHHQYCKQELDHHHHHHQLLHYNNNNMGSHDQFLQLPQLESPKLVSTYGHQQIEHHHHNMMINNNINEQGGVGVFVHDQLTTTATTDWRVLDKFVASQLMSHDHDQDHTRCKQVDTTTTTSYSDHANNSSSLHHQLTTDQQVSSSEVLASMSTPTSEIDLWK